MCAYFFIYVLPNIAVDLGYKWPTVYLHKQCMEMGIWVRLPGPGFQILACQKA